METYKPMDRREWFIMAVTADTRYLPSRCCGRTIYYKPVDNIGDEWCDEHRCDRMTKYGWRCEREAKIAHMCSQHFSQGLRQLLS